MTMRVIPVVDTEKNAWVFEDAELQEFIYPEGKGPLDDDVEPLDNPAYRPDLDVAFANGNAHHMMDRLGLGDHFEDGFGYDVPIDDFIAAAGRVLADVASNPGIFDDTRRISQAMIVATEGRLRGATHLMVH